jgi:Rieske Fe-S protein
MTEKTKKDEPRRTFLKVAFGLLSGLMATVVGGPILVAFFDPMRRKTVAGGEGSAAPYGKVEDLPVGVPAKVNVVSARSDAWDRSTPKPIGAIWLVRREARVDAYSVVCPHLGCPVGYDADKKVFACPCHESAFSVADGARLKGPSPRGLDPLPVEIKDGTVHVTYKRFIQGVSERREA